MIPVLNIVIFIWHFHYKKKNPHSSNNCMHSEQWSMFTSCNNVSGKQQTIASKTLNTNIEHLFSSCSALCSEKNTMISGGTKGGGKGNYLPIPVGTQIGQNQAIFWYNSIFTFLQEILFTTSQKINENHILKINLAQLVMVASYSVRKTVPIAGINNPNYSNTVDTYLPAM